MEVGFFEGWLPYWLTGKKEGCEGAGEEGGWRIGATSSM